MDEEGFKKTCIREKKKRGGIHQPFYGTYVADFMMRQDAGRFTLGKYLKAAQSRQNFMSLRYFFLSLRYAVRLLTF